MSFVQLPMFDPGSAWRPPKLHELPSWADADRVAIDTETCDPDLRALGPGVRRNGCVVGISFAIDGGPAFYLPIAHSVTRDNMHAPGVWAYLRSQARAFTGTIVGMNLPYDLDYLAEQGVVFRGAEWFRDIGVAAPLINELHMRYSMDDIAKRMKIESKDEAELRLAAQRWCVDPKAELYKLPARYVAEYAIRDVTLPLEVLRIQELEIERQDLTRVWNLESELLPITVKMRRRGVRIDQGGLERVQDWALEQQKEFLERVRHATGVNIAVADINQKDPVVKALAAIGFRDLPTTPTGKPKTDEATMRSLDHDVPRWILRAKKFDKMRNTFCKSLWRHLVNGRVHPTLRQIKGAQDGRDDESGGKYGRTSCIDPNFQQQYNPEKEPEISGRWREILLPDDGALWAACDYCYDDQTEILTRRGWVRFPDLKNGEDVAQWDEGVVTYVKPTEKIVGDSPGHLVHLRGDRQVDLAVTPNHRCYYRDHRGRVHVRSAAESVPENWSIPQNGVKDGTIDQDPRLAVAVQADASSRGPSYRFYLKKKAKIHRLTRLLLSAGVRYTTGPVPSKPGFRYFTVPKTAVGEFLLGGIKKNFNRNLVMQLTPERRRQFVDETLHWDGCRSSGAYYSTNLWNCEVVQEAAVLTGFRSNFTVLHPGYRKPKGVVTITQRSGTYTKTLTKAHVPYDGKVYCVTVPSGAVMVRRNGRVMVSGNSAQEPRMAVHYAAAIGAPGGPEMAQRWTDDPDMDLHSETAKLVGHPCKACGGPGCAKCNGCGCDRKGAKIIFLGLCYGMGGGKLCRSLGFDTVMKEIRKDVEIEVAGEEGQNFLTHYHSMVPWVRALSNMATRAAKERGFVRTFGGRKCRFPKKGRGYEYTHKALNRIIQGSAADQTKRAIVEVEKAGIPIQLCIHDELTASVESREQAQQIGEIMENCIELLVPAKVDVEVGTSWGTAK